MDMKKTAMTVLFFFLAIWLAGDVESAPAPAPAVDCSTLIQNMVGCLSYVTAGSTVNTPEGTCCSGLNTVLKTDAECLCEVFKNSAQFGLTLNITKALALPSACHVSASSVNNCGLSLLAPGPAPVGTAGNTPTTIPKSSGSVAFSAFIGSLIMVLIVALFTFV